MNIGIASDHRGVKLKESLKKLIESLSHSVTDYGTNTEASCDYPDYIKQPCEAVADKKQDMAIVICGSGIGASIVANKIHGIRAALCHNHHLAEYSRRHNNANCLALGADIIDETTAKDLVTTFLTTDFEGGRHEKRVEKITALES